ncbi:peptidoglycan DD-metalloendopeptidase family protein [bacterium]|nr:peptidoglycan DD-metalloendopeptidase family protein [bacterium]
MFSSSKKGMPKRYLLILLFILLTPGFVFSASLQDKLNELNRKIESYKEEIENSQKKAETLQEQLTSLSQQIATVETQIKDTEEKITATEKEIIRLSQEIEANNKKLAEQESILDDSLRFLYETGDTPFLELLLASDSFNQALDRMEYISWVEKEIEETVAKIEAIKKKLESDLSQQQNKKKELSNLKEELRSQRNALEYQSEQKQYLLSVTKGQEEKYQEYLAKAKEEFRRVQAQLARLFSGNYVSYGHVKQGDIIGYQGNTGFSTGSHLHFGVYIGNQDVDPLPYLQSGRLAWPFPLGSFVITQGYWGTFSHRGRGWPGGLDLVAYDGAPVRAAADGEIIANVRQDWGFGHFMIVDHGDIKTLYAHLK